MKLKTFRGKLADGAENQIRITTKQGLVGYKINKFQIITEEPYGGGHAEHVVQVSQFSRTPTATINFDDPNILAVAIINNSASGYQYASNPVIIFDTTKINQDFFISHVDSQSSQACNYYLELEQIKLSVDEAAVATLKDMRGRE